MVIALVYFMCFTLQFIEVNVSIYLKFRSMVGQCIMEHLQILLALHSGIAV